MTITIDTVDPAAGRRVALVEAALIWNHLALNDVRIGFRDVAAPRVSVVIVSHGAGPLLALTLYRLAAQQDLAGVAFEVIVVDNASDAETRTLFSRLDGARVVQNAENVGFGPACNAGAALARAPHILFLNPDIDLMPGAMKALVDTLEEFDEVGIVGARLVFPGGILQEAGANFRDDEQVTHPYGRGWTDPFAAEAGFARDVGYVSGAVLLIERALFEELGGFDDRYAPAYFEDTDLCVRVLQKGRRVVYQPRATAIHVENATSPRREDVERLLDRNRALFRERHGAWLFEQGPQRRGFGGRDQDAFALRVLVVDDFTPHQDLGAGLPRANGVLNAMADLGYAVTFCSVFGTGEEPAARRRDLSTRIEVIDPCGPEGIAKLIQERPDYYDVLWVSRPANIDLVCQIVDDLGLTLRRVGRSRVIFDSEALFAVRAFVTAALNGEAANAATLAREARRETRNFPRADHVVCVSQAEAGLVARYGRANAAVLGHALAPRPDPPGFAGRHGFLFIGSLAFAHEPNVDSLVWLLDAVWPRLRRRLPEARFDVVGQVAPAVAERLARPGVTVHGRVADPGPLFDAARVSVAPTRFAAGIPHKVHEAVSRGLPGVVTPILADQIGWPEGTGYRVRDWRDPEGFADALVHLHEDRATWEAVQRAGLERLRIDCAPAPYATLLRRLCEAPTFA
ncbi:glycosyl transferase [Methylobacterium sp. Leaf399]|uniref:glycosyltransferase n=1 Tax=unclassified Methylobacterium TaxID=2615210 RepID=UPI0006F2FF55|nr:MULTISPECIES: glycosyltransferase [unclassified Methylobacterium]KQP61652.1 glycosyl transferase [Methylobacterium sp. Leaf108]KQT20023.1 glycosyl transferase [Methylobacterium sp. Leaf399]